MQLQRALHAPDGGGVSSANTASNERIKKVRYSWWVFVFLSEAFWLILFNRLFFVIPFTASLFCKSPIDSQIIGPLTYRRKRYFLIIKCTEPFCSCRMRFFFVVDKTKTQSQKRKKNSNRICLHINQPTNHQMHYINFYTSFCWKRKLIESLEQKHFIY